ncbi:palmitoyl-acyl carrier protein thioesterase, chloroplastic [Tanacetum coccineum]
MGVNNRSYNYSKEDQTQKISKSVFITNFPDDFTARDLWNVCLAYGNVIDVYIPIKKSKEGTVSNSFAAVLKSGSVNHNTVTESSPAIVLNDACIMERDFSCFLMGKMKDINALSNLFIILANEGFENVKLFYLGGQWVLLELDSVTSKEKITNHVGVGSWFEVLKPACNSFVCEERLVWVAIEGLPVKALTRNTYAKIIASWGELVDINESDNCSLSCIRVDDVIQIDTWRAVSGKNSGRTDWLFRDSQTGKILVRASSNWVMMNKETRRLSKYPDEVRAELEPYYMDTPPIIEKDTKSNTELDKSIEYVCKGLLATWKDLDMNQHVNNVKYLGWILESVPKRIQENYELASMTLEYRRECRKDNVLQSQTFVLSNNNGEKADQKHDDCHIYFNRGECKGMIMKE